jgi:hypothetical protein
MIPALISVLLWILVLGQILGLFYWVATQIPIFAPFLTVIRVVVTVIFVLFVILLLLPFLGQQPHLAHW